MFPDFLPASVNQIRDPQAIALLQQIQRQTLSVTFSHSVTAIDTAFIHAGITESLSSSISSSTLSLLFLHGFDSSLLEFRRILPSLTNQQNLWAIDLYGSGFTRYSAAVPVNSQTIRFHLQQTIATWIQSPVILIGASLGGAVAIDLALHYPDWVKAIILIDSVGFSGSFPIGSLLPTPLIQLGTTWLNFRKRAALGAATWLPANPRLTDDLRCSLLHQEMPHWSDAVLSFTQSGGYEISDRIAEIQQPTLILWGTKDDILGTADAEKFQQTIPNSQLAWIDRAGHAPHLDQPQQVSDRILEFCRDR